MRFTKNIDDCTLHRCNGGHSLATNLPPFLEKESAIEVQHRKITNEWINRNLSLLLSLFFLFFVCRPWVRSSEHMIVDMKLQSITKNQHDNHLLNRNTNSYTILRSISSNTAWSAREMTSCLQQQQGFGDMEVGRRADSWQELITPAP